jgi:nanoRNase/pAp phosphatase (c-di-AMP/oligoRNAs hydrolase)
MEAADRRSSVPHATAEEPLPHLPSGVRPVDHLRSVLLDRAGARGGGPLLVLTHRSPDPDAMGALAGVGALLEAFDLPHEIATVGRIFRAENQAMVHELDLRFADYDRIDPTRFGGALLVDSQPGFSHTRIPEGVPVLAVLDHHEPPPLELRTPVPHYDLRIGVGATSAIVWEYLRDAGVALDARTATALCCGVRFDTADLSVQATPLDQEAFYATFQSCDRVKLAHINRPSLPPSYYRELHRSLSRARRYGPLVFGLLGRVKNPESVAEMADFFLRLEGCRWTLVGGAYDSTYHLSLRTDVGYGEAYPLLQQILDGEGSFGGRGTVAGGQVQLESADDPAIKRLERRLRGRALKLIDPSEMEEADSRTGTRLTRLS